MRKRIYEAGQRFSSLEIIEAYKVNDGNRWMHLVLCDCGNARLVGGSDLKQGKVKTCGCRRWDSVTTHGMTNTAEYKIWASMIQRCTNSSSRAYKNYGGRGVSVSGDWLSFELFINDMGVRPERNMTLERVNNSKGYSKENCVWADRFQQARNTRNRADNKTGFRGVSVKGDKFIANHQRNNKRAYLGSFDTAEEANQAIQNYKESKDYE
ncbi:DNA-binding domain protein [Vibrio phage 1.038.O._10N.286.51.C2]|nr:DNA-binding domain protein [Vibrio phage 1.038.O._10N.286.51.C2]